MVSRIIGFPDVVNEKAARVVATGVLMVALVVVSSGWLWLVPVLALGFLARVLTGPRLSPLGQLATRAVAPHLGAPRLVPGAPKRFAQGVGLAVTTSASILGPVLGLDRAAIALVGVLAVFALLEAGLGFCAGCWAFGHLIRLGLIPQSACEACSDISLRTSASGVG